MSFLIEFHASCITKICTTSKGFGHNVVVLSVKS